MSLCSYLLVDYNLILYRTHVIYTKYFIVPPGQTQDFADNTHFNPYGAYEIARCIVEGLKTQVLDLARHLKPFPAFNPAHPDNPDNFHWDDSPFTEVEKPDGN